MPADGAAIDIRAERVGCICQEDTASGPRCAQGRATSAQECVAARSTGLTPYRGDSLHQPSRAALQGEACGSSNGDGRGHGGAATGHPAAGRIPGAQQNPVLAELAGRRFQGRARAHVQVVRPRHVDDLTRQLSRIRRGPCHLWTQGHRVRRVHGRGELGGCQGGVAQVRRSSIAMWLVPGFAPAEASRVAHVPMLTSPSMRFGDSEDSPKMKVTFARS